MALHHVGLELCFAANFSLSGSIGLNQIACLQRYIEPFVGLLIIGNGVMCLGVFHISICDRIEAENILGIRFWVVLVLQGLVFKLTRSSKTGLDGSGSNCSLATHVPIGILQPMWPMYL